MIPTTPLAGDNGTFLLHFAAYSTTEAKQKLLKQKVKVQNAYISAIEQLTKFTIEMDNAAAYTVVMWCRSGIWLNLPTLGYY